MHQKTFLATGTWVAIGLSTWTVAWIIAESIPVFNELLSLIVCSRGFLLFITKRVLICCAEFPLRKLVQL